jgi:hypothetical protein
MATIESKNVKSRGVETRETGTLALTSVANTTHLATITFDRAFRSTPKFLNAGTDSTYGIVLSKGVQAISTTQCVVGFRSHASGQADVSITVYADVEGEF